MAELQFEFDVTDDEIRPWMDAEIVRLGEWLKNFTITWHCNEFRYWLEIWSESKTNFIRSSDPVGKCFRIGEVASNEGWLALPVIQHEGRKLYHRLKKDYPVVRDLGKGNG